MWNVNFVEDLIIGNLMIFKWLKTVNIFKITSVKKIENTYCNEKVKFFRTIFNVLLYF